MPRTAHAWREEGQTWAGFRAASRGIGVISGAGGRGVTAGQSLEWRRRAEEPRGQAARDREPLLSSSPVRIAY